MFSDVWLRLYNENLETRFKRLSTEFRSSDQDHTFLLKLHTKETKGYVLLAVEGLENFDNQQVQLV